MDADAEKLLQLDIRKIEEIPEDYWKKATNEKQLKRISLMLDYEYGDKVLEIGPCRGYLALCLCKAKPNIRIYDAVEIDEAFASQCSKMAAFNNAANINCIQGDGCNLKNLKKKNYNTVIMAEVLEHVYTPLKMLQEACKALARYGHIIVTVPTKGRMPPEKTPDHVQDFTVDDVKSLLSTAGFQLLHHTQFISWEYYLAIKK